MKIHNLVCFAFLILAASGGTAASPDLGKETEQKIQVDGTERSYLVFTPSALGKEKVPVMIVLHGGTGNAHHSSRTMGMNEVAEQNQFLVVYPDGTSTALGENRRVWNAGGCCAIAQRKNIDDVKFIDLVVKDVLKKYSADSHRVYVTGESNGAMLTYRLMCELPDVFAAAIPVSGTLMVDSCKAGQKVALYDLHGSADKNVPYQGGKGEGLSRATYRSVPDSIQIITKLRGCLEAQIQTLANGDTQTNYSCKSGAPVRSLLIKDGGHAWPVSKGSEKNSHVSAAEEAWNFAKAFSRP